MRTRELVEALQEVKVPHGRLARQRLTLATRRHKRKPAGLDSHARALDALANVPARRRRAAAVARVVTEFRSAALVLRGGRSTTSKNTG